MQRYIAEGPAHLVAQHGRDFATGAALLAAVVAGAPIGDVPAFIAARTDGGGGGGGGGAATDGGSEVEAGGPCVSPGAVELLLREVAALPLNQVPLRLVPSPLLGRKTVNAFRFYHVTAHQRLHSADNQRSSSANST